MIGYEEAKYSADWVNLGTQRRFMHRWAPFQAVRGHVCIVHGLGEHGGRYVRLAPHLAKLGYAVSAFDQQGHGRTPGRRGVIISYDSLLDEIEGYLKWAMQVDPDVPCFLFGHSMGGNLVVNYVLRRETAPRAMIASSPMFISPREPKGMLNVMARAASRLVPNLRVGIGAETKQLMDDPAEQQLLDNDPLFHRQASLRLGAALIDSGRWALENATKLRVPTLITHGTLDRITLPEGSKQFSMNAGSICQLQLLTDHLHESFRDQRRQQVIDIYVQFLEGHLG
jgi:alpha-beta hydrolase superfamily lysophospholipase